MQYRSRILIQQLGFTLPNSESLFNQLTHAFPAHKTGLVGRNGVGKSTLIKLIIGELHATSGTIQIDGILAYVPQNPIVKTNNTIAETLGFADKIDALHRINQGSIDENDFNILDEDWQVETRLQQQLNLFHLDTMSHNRYLNELSGGELTRVLLIKAFFSNADFLLLDEPTNHLDNEGRKQLYDAITHWPGGMIVISHDRNLLNLMDEIVELNTLGMASYGGNYDAYVAQKKIETAAKELALHDAKKLLQQTKQTIQSTREKHEHKQAYGKQLRKNRSIDKISANSKKGRSERSQSKMLIKKERLLNQAHTNIKAAWEKIEITDEIQVELPKTFVPNGKVILEMENVLFSYAASNPIIENFNLKILGPQRIALAGKNGCGKTTLVKLILAELLPQQGKIYLGTPYISYLDQTASLLNPLLSVLDNFLHFNANIKIFDAYHGLAQFLFKNVTALKLVKDLSGGEKLRALLACVLLSQHPPQLLILDEPTNHLDLNSIISIESALKKYQGTLIVISHDQKFLENIDIDTVYYLDRCDSTMAKRNAL
jgi:ATPase subunit of ABC transporter with duplicated ATPase domains